MFFQYVQTQSMLIIEFFMTVSVKVNLWKKYTVKVVLNTSCMNFCYLDIKNSYMQNAKIYIKISSIHEK